jgi:transcriptional regulator with XRE-family HTH domain
MNNATREPEATAVIEMDLAAYRTSHGLTWDLLAQKVGASSPRQVRAWALGIERPSETQRARIAEVTDGVVSVLQMHLVRLKWERQHKRPLASLRRPPRPSRGRPRVFSSAA